MTNEDVVLNFVLDNCVTVPAFANVSKEIVKANTNARLVKRIKRFATENASAAKALAGVSF